MKNWQSATVRPTNSVREVLEALDRSGLQIALVLDGVGRLLGTVTDGDIRRGLLKGIDLSAAVEAVMNPRPLIGRSGMTRTELIETLRRHSLHHLPLVDMDGRVVGLESDVDLLEGAERENAVVLMAGGLGQRLRPLTEEVPKPLLPIGNRPLLEISIDRFIMQGFRKFYISVNYLAEQVEAHFGDGGKLGAEIRYLREPRPLGTAGAISLLPERPTQPFIVMNGDLLTTVAFDKMLEFHERHDADITLCVRRYSHQVPYGVAEIVDDQVISIVEKPNQECFISGGIYVLNPNVCDRLNPDQPIDMPDLIRNLIADRRRVTAFPVTEYWIDIGRMEDLERAREQAETQGRG
jgi:dTDP-glucose pyrophosphorylase/CBS domain-containing protein